MARRSKERGGAGLLDDDAQIHDCHAVGDMTHHAEIVADEQVREATLVAEVLEELQDLRLDRDIQCAYWLIGDDQFRIDRQRPGDADPLPLPT